MKNLIGLFGTASAVIAFAAIGHSFVTRGTGFEYGEFFPIAPDEGAAEFVESWNSPSGQAHPPSANPSESFQAALYRAALASRSAPPAFQEMYRDRSSWPRTVRLEELVHVAIEEEGRRAGTIGFPAGRELSVEGIQADGKLLLASRTTRFEVDYAKTNLLAQTVLDRQAELEWLRMIDQRRTLLALERGARIPAEARVASDSGSTSPEPMGELAAASPDGKQFGPRDLAALWESYAKF